MNETLVKKNGLWRFFDVFFSHQALRIGLLVMVTLRSCQLLSIYVGPAVKFTLIWSAAILVRDLFTNRLLFTNRYRGILYLFLILYAGTILVMRQDNLSRNLSSLLYMVTNFFVMYAYDLKKDRETAKRELVRLSHVFMWLTFIGHIITLVIFLLNIHYRFTYIYKGEEVRCYLGFFGGRIWGFYSNPNAAGDFAIVNFLLMGICLVILGRAVTKWQKRFYIANFVVQSVIFFLANSRTAWVCAIFYLLTTPIFMLLLLKSKDRKKPDGQGKPMKYWLKRAAALAVVAALAFTGANAFVKAVLPKLVIPTTFFSKQLAQLPGSDSPDPKEDPELFEVPEDLERSDFGSQFGGRYYLWKAGLKVIGNHPLWGVGAANLPDYAREYSLSPEMKDVDPESEEFKEPYLPGIQSGGMHNMVLQVAVCSGLLGLLAIGFFAICFFIRVTRYFKMSFKRGRVEPVTVMLGAGILTILVRSMTEIGLIYSVYYSSVIFWSLVGALLYFIEKDAQDDPELGLSKQPLLAKLSEKVFRR